MHRFAPSLERDMFVSDLKVAILNFISARQRDEKFLLYIEDLNKNINNIDEKIQEILAILDIFTIKPDDIIYQSNNLKFYQQLATKLLIDKKAFNCFCDSREDEENRCKRDCQKLTDIEVLDRETPFSVRLKADNNSEKIDDFIILKTDKKPAKNFAIAIDDMLNDISLVVEKNREILNSKKQTYIRKSLGYDKDIEYIYFPNIENDILIKELLDDGFSTNEILKYILSLGYEEYHEDIFTLNDAINWFDFSKITYSKEKFDKNMLKKVYQKGDNK